MIIGAPKTGKSTIMALLPNSGILNIEPGGIDGYRFLKHVAVTNDLKSLDEFKKLVGEAITWSKANDNKNYIFILNLINVFNLLKSLNDIDSSVFKNVKTDFRLSSLL
jgi:hypothetical protein